MTIINPSKRSPLRIVSLLSSATEIACALGFDYNLVGRSHECDYPEFVKDLPQCSKPSIDINGTSFEIDQRVKQNLQNALSLYEIDSKLVKELKPDIILTQTQCEVCAVSLKDVELQLSDLIGTHVKVVSLNPNSLSDVWNDIRNIAEALGVPSRGIELIQSLKSRMSEISKKAHNFKRPTVACIEWIDPLMAAGNWVPELVDKAGGKNLFGIAGKHSPWMTFEQLVEKDPGVIIIMPCGYTIGKSWEELPSLTSRPGWEDLRAVRNRRVFVVEGNQYFNRPGPRLVESLEIMAELFHPDEFEFGHEKSGWERI